MDAAGRVPEVADGSVRPRWCRWKVRSPGPSRARPHDSPRPCPHDALPRRPVGPFDEDGAGMTPSGVTRTTHGVPAGHDVATSA